MKALGNFVFLHNTIQETVSGLVLQGHLQILSVGGLVPLQIEEGYSVIVNEEELIPIDTETSAIHWEYILGYQTEEMWRVV